MSQQKAVTPVLLFLYFSQLGLTNFDTFEYNWTQSLPNRVKGCFFILNVRLTDL